MRAKKAYKESIPFLIYSPSLTKVVSFMIDIAAEGEDKHLQANLSLQ